MAPPSSPAAPHPPHQTNPNALRAALLTRINRKIFGGGQVTFPCTPAFLDVYLGKLVALFDALGKSMKGQEIEALRKTLDEQLRAGWAVSAHSQLMVAYETVSNPEPSLKYRIGRRMLTLADEYEGWVEGRQAPYFGKLPDAKLMELAAALGAPSTVPILDVGAGSGRNAIPLARLGHPVDAVEPAPAMVTALTKDAAAANVTIRVFDKSVVDRELALPPKHYKLIVLAEVFASHFRDVKEVRAALEVLVPSLAEGGILLFSVFVAKAGYKPDAAALEVGHTMWSCVYTPDELAAAMRDMPLVPLADESVYDFEKEHLPAEGWPPTGWFTSWTLGKDVFELPGRTAPIELRWLSYRRTAST